MGFCGAASRLIKPSDYYPIHCPSLDSVRLLLHLSELALGGIDMYTIYIACSVFMRSRVLSAAVGRGSMILRTFEDTEIHLCGNTDSEPDLEAMQLDSNTR